MLSPINYEIILFHYPLSQKSTTIKQKASTKKNRFGSGRYWSLYKVKTKQAIHFYNSFGICML